MSQPDYAENRRIQKFVSYINSLDKENGKKCQPMSQKTTDPKSKTLTVYGLFIKKPRPHLSVTTNKDGAQRAK